MTTSGKAAALPRSTKNASPGNIYAATEEECEEQLAELIAAMKKELAPLRAGRKAG